MESQSTIQLVRVLRTIVIAAIVFAVCTLVSKLQYGFRIGKLPIISPAGEKGQKAFIVSARKLYMDGYSKFKDLVFTLINENGTENVVIPQAYYRNFENCLTMFRAFQRPLLKQVNRSSKLMKPSNLFLLTTVTVRLNPIICQEIDTTIRSNMPPYEDWMEVNINEKLISIIAQVTGGVLVGTELARSSEYLDMATNFILEIVNTTTAVKKLRPWLNPFLAPRLKETALVNKSTKQAESLLRPIIQERIEAKDKDHNWQRPDDMIQWMLDADQNDVDAQELGGVLLSLIFAAIDTTSKTTTNIMYTLASMPEYFEAFREEIRSVIAQECGIVTFHALQNMEELDSCMGKVLRFNSNLITPFTRQVLKDLTLSNDQIIPAGVIIEITIVAVYQDGEFYPEAEKFDGLRAYKARSTGKTADIVSNQIIAANETNLNFGYDRSAWPGGFLAANVIKMIIVRLLLDYDFKMPNSERERYPQIEIAKVSIQDQTKTLAFKKTEI